ncbi:MAG: ATP-binding protein [Alphaproteobacteria bacterium PA4]|nr:MAG: ATP-binding protein [Alphaproteobacteria bacterium PA4]
MNGLGTRFEIGLVLRIALLLAAGALLAWVLTRPGLYATTLLAGLATGVALAEVWLFVRRTNLAVARFVESVSNGDFTMAFSGNGGGFDTLAASLNDAMARLRSERAETQDDNRFLSAMLDDAPGALLSLDPAGRLSLLNKAARRLLAPGNAVRIEDLASFGDGFVSDIATMKPGERRSTQLNLAGAPVAALLIMSDVRQARGAQLRILAVQPIQQELDRAELAAQTDLVRVLTHEIMNSMTPVTSLSATAASLIAAADTGHDPAIADARAAIETVARRAEGVMHFVRTYRQLTRPPTLRRRRVELATLFAELKRLFESDWPTLPLTIDLAPPGLAIDADPDLLAQLLINLLRNAAEAAATQPSPAVSLVGTALPGGRTAIDVIDNGPGVPEDLRQDIFLPFFSTKSEGTGVGLSLARQIALAHDAALSCEPVAPQGTRFRLLL